MVDAGRLPNMEPLEEELEERDDPPRRERCIVKIRLVQMKVSRFRMNE